MKTLVHVKNIIRLFCQQLVRPIPVFALRLAIIKEAVTRGYQQVSLFRSGLGERGRVPIQTLYYDARVESWKSPA